MLVYESADCSGNINSGGGGDDGGERLRRERVVAFRISSLQSK